VLESERASVRIEESADCVSDGVFGLRREHGRSPVPKRSSGLGGDGRPVRLRGGLRASEETGNPVGSGGIFGLRRERTGRLESSLFRFRCARRGARPKRRGLRVTARKAGLADTKGSSDPGATDSSFGGKGASAPAALGCGLRIHGETSVSTRSERSRSNRLWPSGCREASGMSGPREPSGSRGAGRCPLRRGLRASVERAARLPRRSFGFGGASACPTGGGFGLSRKDDHSARRGFGPEETSGKRVLSPGLRSRRGSR
jgi:hypothetical protein